MRYVSKPLVVSIHGNGVVLAKMSIVSRFLLET